MKVIRDYWREYTEEEKEALKQAKHMPVREIKPEIREMLRRSKEYEVNLSDGERIHVDIEEFCLDWKYIKLSLLDSKGIDRVYLGLTKKGEDIGDCFISLYDVDLGNGKRVIIEIQNYNYFGRVIGWFSASEGQDYKIISQEGKFLQSGRLKNMEDFGNRLVEKAFSGFDLLVEGRAEEWLEDWLSSARELLQEQIGQGKKILRR